MKLFFFDTETTWTDPENDRIIQFGWIFWDFNLSSKEFIEIERINQFINIPIKIPEWASKVHHIYNKDLIKFKYIDSYIGKFLSLIYNADYVIWHNVDFDKKMVIWECKRIWIEFDEYQIWRIDTMKIATELVKIPNWRWWYKWPKLIELYKFLFGKEFDWAHDAMADITATKDCFIKLYSEYDLFYEINKIEKIEKEYDVFSYQKWVHSPSSFSEVIRFDKSNYAQSHSRTIENRNLVSDGIMCEKWSSYICYKDWYVSDINVWYALIWNDWAYNNFHVFFKDWIIRKEFLGGSDSNFFRSYTPEWKIDLEGYKNFDWIIKWFLKWYFPNSNDIAFEWQFFDNKPNWYVIKYYPNWNIKSMWEYKLWIANGYFKFFSETWFIEKEWMIINWEQNWYGKLYNCYRNLVFDWYMKKFVPNWLWKKYFYDDKIISTWLFSDDKIVNIYSSDPIEKRISFCFDDLDLSSLKRFIYWKIEKKLWNNVSKLFIERACDLKLIRKKEIILEISKGYDFFETPLKEQKWYIQNLLSSIFNKEMKLNIITIN